jgi:hypothetical protein
MFSNLLMLMEAFLLLQAASLLGTATLAVQTVVLASSLAASMPTRPKSLSTASRTFTSSNVINPNPLTEVLRESEGPVESAGADIGTQRVRRRGNAQLKEGPDPANMLDGRAVWVVSGVRLLLLPLVNLFLTLGLMRAHILPADPVCGLVLMVSRAICILFLLSLLKKAARFFSHSPPSSSKPCIASHVSLPDQVTCVGR